MSLSYPILILIYHFHSSYIIFIPLSLSLSLSLPPQCLHLRPPPPTHFPLSHYFLFRNEIILLPFCNLCCFGIGFVDDDLEERERVGQSPHRFVRKEMIGLGNHVNIEKRHNKEITFILQELFDIILQIYVQRR